MKNLTKKVQFSVKCKDNKSRNYILYFLNNVQILKLKIPFDTSFEKGSDRVTFFTDEYIKDNRLYIKKVKYLCYKDGKPLYKERWTSYPLSKHKYNASTNTSLQCL